jgi:hypothetical protein
MDKKSRTGLQSKISHIFAGVPIPRKKSPLSEPPQDQKKDNIVDMTQSSLDEVVIDDALIGEGVSEQQEVESQFVEKQIQKEDVELSAEQKPEQEPAEEQFSAIQDEDQETQAPAPPDAAQTKEPEQIEIVEEPEGRDEPLLEEAYLEHLMSPHVSIPKPMTRDSQVQRPQKQETKAEKPLTEKDISAPPVRKPAVEKPSQSINKKIEIGGVLETLDTQKLSVGKIPTVEAIKTRDLQPSRKIVSKPAAKRLKTKAGAGQPRQKTMAILFVVLSIVLVMVLGRQFNIFSSSSDTSGTVEQSGPVSAAEKNAANMVIDWPVPPLYPDNLPDPMKSPPPEQGGKINEIIDHPDLYVTGTSGIQGGQYQVSIIGKELPYKAGDVIKDKGGRDVKILDVQNNQILFEMNGVVWIYYVDSKSWTQNQ